MVFFVQTWFRQKYYTRQVQHGQGSQDARLSHWVIRDLKNSYLENSNSVCSANHILLNLTCTELFRPWTSIWSNSFPVLNITYNSKASVQLRGNLKTFHYSQHMGLLTGSGIGNGGKKHAEESEWNKTIERYRELNNTAYTCIFCVILCHVPQKRDLMLFHQCSTYRWCDKWCNYSEAIPGCKNTQFPPHSVWVLSSSQQFLVNPHCFHCTHEFQ